MRRIFTFSFLAIALTLASFNSFAQCTNFTVNFNSGTSTGGFLLTRTSGTGTFTAPAVTSQQLRTTVTAGSPTTYAFTSPVLQTLNTTDPINFTFLYGNGVQAPISSVQYSIKYIDNTGNVSYTTPQTYTAIQNGTCISVARPSNMSTTDNRFQVIAYYNVTSGNGNSSNGWISFDEFGTNGASTGQATLPVKFSAFEAKAASNGVALNWSVGTENNVSGYAIEKSNDGRSFTKIGFVAADGKSSYSFVDAQGAGAVAYYRVKSVDNDGKYNFSTVAVLRGGKAAIVLRAFPSPFINKLSVQHGTANAGSLIAISSEDGRTIRSIVPAIGTQQTEIDLTTAKAGLYLVRYSNGNGTVETLKVLKQ